MKSLAEALNGGHESQQGQQREYVSYSKKVCETATVEQTTYAQRWPLQGREAPYGTQSARSALQLLNHQTKVPSQLHESGPKPFARIWSQENELSQLCPCLYNVLVPPYRIIATRGSTGSVLDGVEACALGSLFCAMTHWVRKCRQISKPSEWLVTVRKTSSSLELSTGLVAQGAHTVDS